MKYPLVFVGKHPCDEMPYIVGTVPDPQSGHPAFTFDGPDYSGYYIKLPRWFARRFARMLYFYHEKRKPLVPRKEVN